MVHVFRQAPLSAVAGAFHKVLLDDVLDHVFEADFICQGSSLLAAVGIARLLDIVYGFEIAVRRRVFDR